MSKEFEEIVLKKLEKLDDLDTTVQDVVLKKLEKLDVLEKEVKSNQESIKKLNDNFTVFDFEINKKLILYLMQLQLTMKSMIYLRKVLFL